MWRVFLTTFGLVFLAELGDKTQLATMLLATQNKAVGAVFLGSALALVLSSLIGVTAGSILVRYVSPHFLRTAAGIGFIIMGGLLLWGKI